MKTYIIYKLSGKLENEVYVGQTKNTIEQRYKNYKKDSSGGSKLIRKYGGLDCIKVEILEQNLSLKEANKKEIEFINIFDSINFGLNISLGGGNHSQQKSRKVFEYYENILVAEYESINSASIFSDVHYMSICRSANENMCITNVSKIRFSFDKEVFFDREVFYFDESPTLENFPNVDIFEIKQEISKLKKNFKDVVELRICENLNHKEISKILNISVSKSQDRLRFGINKLGENLKIISNNNNLLKLHS